jgi:hypothetical protein
MRVKNMVSKVLFVGISSLALVVSACASATTTTPTPTVATSLSDELSATMVPNTDIDMYFFVKQATPTTVPKSLIGTPIDIVAESLSLWGIVNEDNYTIGGALVFASAADAALIESEIPGQSETWTELSDRTIYLVQGSGAAADELKAAITSNDFKRYDDTMALDEVALMPSGGSTIPAAVLIIKPNQAMIDQVKQYADQASSDMLNTIFSWARPQVITLGLYAPQQIDIVDLVQRLEQNTVWDVDLGVVVSIKSAWPGFIVSPIAGRILDNSGYTKTTLGDLTVYDGSFDAGGTAVSVLLNIVGNRLWATTSSQESYARTLMTAITR